MSYDFYSFKEYKNKQSFITQQKWKEGVFDHLYKNKREKRKCFRKGCNNVFEVELNSSKKYCSQSCAVKINNSKRAKGFNRPELKRLYQQGLSMIEIAECKKCSYYKVKYWMSRYGIKKRSRAELSYRGYWRKTSARFEIPNSIKFPKSLDIEKIKQLYYHEGCSARQIANYYQRSLKSVYLFMEKHGLKRRIPAESNRLNYQKQPLSFKPIKNLTDKQEKLKVAGIMLYWAEGAKLKEENRTYTVDFANSDPEMVKIFIRFLREICRVDENKFKLRLYCYADQNVNKLKRYWSRITKISISRHIKPYVRSDFKKEKSGKMKYGLIHIMYYDKKLLLQIENWIKEYIKGRVDP